MTDMTAQPVPSPRRYTVADYMAMDDDVRYELLEGELILVPAPALPHQSIITRLGSYLDLFVAERELGRCFDTPFDVVLADDTVVQPDFTFVRKERLSIALNHKGGVAAPDLVIEVLSPSTAHRDRGQKRDIYARAGVPWLMLVAIPPREMELYELQADGDYALARTFEETDTLEIPCIPGLALALPVVWAALDPLTA